MNKIKTNCVIYKITNTTNGKVYIGKTVQKFEARCKPHRYKSCKALNAAIQKYGWESFSKEIICSVLNESDLASVEEYFIKHFNCLVPNGYNIIDIDKGLNRYTKETKSKISKSRNKYLEALTTPLVAVNKKEHIFVNNVECKVCADCEQTKPLTEFGKNSKRWDKLHMYCKPCWISYNKKYKDTTVKLTSEQLAESYRKRTPKMIKSLTQYYKNKNDYLMFGYEKADTTKSNIWKSLISVKSGKVANKISARKCSIVELDNSQTIKFLNESHLQGYVSASINYGLMFNGELVSLMTFSPARFTDKYQWELIRFCNKLNTIVVGGASRLLTYFENKNKPKSLISYANLRFSNGSLYKTLGFTQTNTTRPNYFYVKDGVVSSRIKFQKHKLSMLLERFDASLTERENMLNNGYEIIEDRGNLVFEKIY